MATRYLMLRKTKEVFVFTELLDARGDMVEIEQDEALRLLGKLAPLPSPIAEPEMSAEERTAAIRAAIAQIPEANWGKSPTGSLPKVGEVSTLAGFKVFGDEIRALVKEVDNDGSAAA